MPQLVILLVLLAAFAAPTALASDHPDHVSLFNTINIPEEESAGDIACAFCTVNIHGNVSGDVAALFGTVNVEPSRSIGGDVALLFGTLRLDEDATVHGDLASLFSTVEIADTATVKGSRAIVPRGVALGILLAPLLILAGVVWLIVYLVRRSRSPYRV